MEEENTEICGGKCRMIKGWERGVSVGRRRRVGVGGGSRKRA